MNILPKKRWHVRTKENIARVRKDEALAAEEAKIEQARIDKAESEARLNFLRNESRKKSGIDIEQTPDLPVPESNLNSTTTKSKHINFFEELEQGSIDYNKSNKDYEKEKKEEQEKYEKQIGLLTYLGQDCKDVNKSWYNELPKKIDDAERNIEFKPNKKSLEDPIQDIRRYMRIISSKKNNEKSVVKCEDLKPCLSNMMKESYLKSNKRKRQSSTECESSEDDQRSKKKHKRHKKHKKSKKHRKSTEKESTKSKSSLDIEKLRAERLEREKQERLKTEALLSELKNKSENDSKPQFQQKYNSQFFPQLARQNSDRNYKRVQR